MTTTPALPTKNQARVRNMVDALIRPRHLRCFRGSYTVELDDWNEMVARLLLDVVLDANSVDVSARAIGLDRGDIEARLAWAQACDHGRGVRESYVIGIDRWERMHADLLLALVSDAARCEAPPRCSACPGRPWEAGRAGLEL
jgi:hypothetical protein